MKICIHRGAKQIGGSCVELEAGGKRFRPIFLTSVTTFVGLLPLLSEKSTQAQFLIPMAISLGFGILFATLITLFLVPINYLVLQPAERNNLYRDSPELVERFGDVQCEICHGPRGEHAQLATKTPAPPVTARVCDECHQGDHDEYGSAESHTG